MNKLKHIKNIITGTYAHWNDTSNSVFLELKDKSKLLDQRISLIFDVVLNTCYSVIDSTIGPNPHNEELVFKIKLKELTKNQCLKIYIILFTSFISIYTLKYPNSKNVIKSHASDFLGLDINKSKLFNQAHEIGLENVSSISFITLDFIIEALNIDSGDKTNKLHLNYSYLFSVIFMTNLKLMDAELARSINEFNKNK